MPDAGRKVLRSIVNPMLPSPGRFWVLNTAFASTVPFDSLIRGPPALTSADSSKSLPVAVDLVVVASVSGSVTVVVHDEVPPPKVMLVFVTFWAVALVGPSTEHLPWTGTLIATSPLVNSAEPIWATPGCGAACAGAAVTVCLVLFCVPASAPRLALVLCLLCFLC